MRKIMSEFLEIGEKSYYVWKNKSHKRLISFIEKYFNEEDLKEFIENGRVSKLEKSNNKEFKEFILNSAIKKIVDAFENRKINDHYILEVVASAIINSDDPRDISYRVSKYLESDNEETKRIRAVFILMSKVEKEMLLENKEVVVKKFEEYIRNMDDLSSLFSFDLFIDGLEEIKINQSLLDEIDK